MTVRLYCQEGRVGLLPEVPWRTGRQGISERICCEKKRHGVWSAGAIFDEQWVVLQTWAEKVTEVMRWTARLGSHATLWIVRVWNGQVRDVEKRKSLKILSINVTCRDCILKNYPSITGRWSYLVKRLWALNWIGADSNSKISLYKMWVAFSNYLPSLYLRLFKEDKKYHTGFVSAEAPWKQSLRGGSVCEWFIKGTPLSGCGERERELAEWGHDFKVHSH